MGITYTQIYLPFTKTCEKRKKESSMPLSSRSPEINTKHQQYLPNNPQQNQHSPNTCSKMADQSSLYLREATSLTLGTCGLRQTKQHLPAAGPQVPSFPLSSFSPVPRSFLVFLEFGSFRVWFV